MAITRTFDSPRLWRHYLNAHALWLAAALLIMPLMPDYTFDSEGNFRGLSEHKNSWAGVALCGALLSAWQVKQVPRSVYAWSLLGISLLTVLLTHSATAISIALMSLVMFTSCSLLLARTDGAKGVFIIGIMALASLPFLWLLTTGTSPVQAGTDTYLALVQKDATLTGRNVLWETVLNHAWQTPWLGSGYGAFWIGDSGPAVAVVAALNWLPVHSHNGYIDLFNELGFLGCAVFGLVIAAHALNIVRVAMHQQGDAALLHLMLTCAVLGYNLAESSILLATHSLWILLVVSIVDAHRLAKGSAKGFTR